MIHDLPKTPRERRHDDNLARITDTAMRMVERGGLEALSINKLAAEVDYTPGALYRYFGSKDALLAALVLRVLGDVRAHVERATAKVGMQASPLVRVFAIAHGYRDFARQRPQRFGLLAMTMAEPRVLLAEPETAAPVALASIDAMQPLADALQAAEHSGHLQPGEPSMRTVAIFALLQGVLQLHKQARFAPEVIDAERLVAFGVRSLLVGWGAKPKSVDAAMLALRGDK
jgi:AcrR family transcriptional regulator